MYNVEFYEDVNGESELWNFLENLRIKAATNKDARIQHKQISLYIQLLADNGTRLNENFTKHLIDDIWELRPGNNRVLYFFFQMIRLCFYTNSVKKHKKHLNVKSNVPKQNEMIILVERSIGNMKTWNDYKEHIKNVDPEIGKDMDEIENISAIINAMVEQRTALGLSQRELATMCGIPQSSVARIESYKTTPTLGTLLNIFQHLGLKLTVSPTKLSL